MYHTCAMATCGYNSFFSSFCNETLAQKWNKKEKLACFLRGAVINRERVAMVRVQYLLFSSKVF